MRRVQYLAVAVAIALGAGACSDETTPTTPTTAPATVTDTFSGTLTKNGAQSYQFITAASGTVTAIVSGIAPDTTLIVGLSLGTWNGNQCQVVLSKDNATLASYVSGTASASGTLCVRIYDVGNIADPITYEIQVNHP